MGTEFTRYSNADSARRKRKGKEIVIILFIYFYFLYQTKCHRYWPGAQPEVYGEINVDMLSETEKSDWIVRKFRITKVNDNNNNNNTSQLTVFKGEEKPYNNTLPVCFVA